MKLKKLSINNFRSITAKEFELSRFNLLYGVNGAGKTSILGAFRYLLNGDLPKDAIKEGEEKLSVSAIIDDGNDTVLEREAYLPEERRINGKVVKDSVFFQYLQGVKAEYAASPYDLKILTHTHSFFHDKDAGILFSFLETGTADGHRILGGIKELEVELKDGTVLYRRASRQNKVSINGKKCSVSAFNDAVSSYGIRDSRALDLVTSSDIMSRLDMADLGTYLLQNLPVKVDFDKLSTLAKLDEDEKKALAVLFPKSPEPINIGHIETAYKQVFDTRTVIGSNARTELKKSVYEDIPPKETREEVNAKIAEINQKIGNINGLVRNHQDYNRILETRKNMSERITYWKGQLDDPKFQGITQPDYQAMQALKAAEATQNQTINVAYNAFYSMKNNVTQLKKVLEAIDTNRCPAYDGIICSTDRSGFRNLLVQQIKDATTAALEAQRNYQDAKKTLGQISGQRDELDKRIKIWEEKLSLERQVKSLVDSMPAEPEAPQPIPDASGLKEELAALNELLPKINLYEESIRAKERYETAMKQYELYDRLVKKTNPKNGLLMAVILEQVLHPFRTHCNALASSIFSDSKVEFSMGERGLEVLYQPHGNNALRKPEALSTGEKMQLTFILMDLVSTISGSRIMVFDNIESLDDDSIGHLLNIVSVPEVRERYDHIIFSVVNHDSIVKKITSIGGIQLIGVTA